MRTRVWRQTDSVATPDILGRKVCRARDRRPPRHLRFLLPLGLAAVLSFYSIATQSLWLDEVYSLAIAGLDWPQMWRRMAGGEANMGLYYILLHCWLQLGTGEFAVRSLSALTAVAVSVPLYGVGMYLFGADVGFIASLLLAVNAFFIQYAQEARSYVLVLLLATSSSYLFLRALDNPSRKNWAGYTVVSALSVYAHFFGALVIAAHFVSAIVSRRGFVGRKRFIISYVCIALLVSPLLATLNTTGDPLFWLERPSWRTLGDLFWVFTGYGEPVLVILYLGVCCFALLSASAQQRKVCGPYIPWNFVFLCTWLLLPVLGSFLFSLLKKPIFHPRYLIISLPPLVLMAAAGVQSLRPVWLRLVTLLLLLVLSGRSLWQLYNGAGPFHKEEWRAATDYVLDNAEVGDGIVFLADYVRRPFEYYVEALHARVKAPHPVFPSAPWGELEVPSQQNSETPRGWLSHNPQEQLRLWLVLAHQNYERENSKHTRWLQDNFEKQFCLIQERSFFQIRVVLYQICPSPKNPTGAYPAPSAGR